MRNLVIVQLLVVKCLHLAKMALKILLLIIPYMGTLFLAVTQPFFWTIGLKFLCELRGLLSIEYRLVMRNHDFDAFLKKMYFWRENERGV